MAEYERLPMNAPQAAGAKLKFLNRLLECPVTGGLLSGTLLKNAGVRGFREVTASHPLPIHVPPSSSPSEPASEEPKVLGPLSELEPPKGPFVSVLDYHRAYEEGRTNPLEVAERLLQAVEESEQLDPQMRFFIAQDAEDILTQARESARRWEEGKPIGMLDGVPVAVKDELDQRGYPTTVGTRFLGKEPKEVDAEVVGRLRMAGALLIGKTNMHEIGLGVTGVNPHYGAARNPYDPMRASGGSSSGSATTVSAGICPISVGADGGGSIRMPAALCGVVGLKPTFGRVSEHGAADLCWSVAHVGPLGASALDAAIGYGIMAGPDPKDPNTLTQPAPTLAALTKESLEGVKIGYWEPWFCHADEEVVRECRLVLEGLVKAGAKIVNVEIPDVHLTRIVHMVTIVSEMSAAMLPYQEAHQKDFGQDTRLNLNLAKRIQASDYVHAQRLRAQLSQTVLEVMQRVHVLVVPSTACTAPIIDPGSLATGESNLVLLEQIMRFSMLANILGLPAISFPAGYDNQGLPVGFQAIGRFWQEDLLLKLALTAESFVERKLPKVHYRLLGAGEA